MKSVQITESTTLSVPCAEDIELALSEIGSAGFVWTACSHSAHLSIVSSRFVPTRTSVGAPGQRLIRVRVLSPGTHELTLEYGRPWESVARQRVTVRIVATE